MLIDGLRNNPSFIVPDWPAPANVIAAVTTRLGGVSKGDYSSFNLAMHVNDDREHVQINREKLHHIFGVDVGFQWLEQVHGTHVIEAKKDAEIVKADAVYTTEKGIVCCITTADCLPIFLASKTGKAVAVVHAGWRGLAGGVVENCLNLIPETRGNMIAWLGPAIGPCHFEVGSEVREKFV